MAGTTTPQSVTEYVAKASPVLPFTLFDDAGKTIDLTGATLSGYILNPNAQTEWRMYGAFTVLDQTLYRGQGTYQWSLIDVNAPGTFQIFISAKLPDEPYERGFAPLIFVVLPTPEYIGGLYVQEVDININGAPPTDSNSIPVDVTDRSGRVLGTVVITSLPAITGAVAPQVNSANVSVSNPLPVTSGQVGLVAPYASNPAATTAATDYQFRWGTGNTTVQRVIISNETGADVRYELDATASANSLRLKDGNTLFLQQPCTTLHLFSASDQNINQAGGIMVRGYN